MFTVVPAWYAAGWARALWLLLLVGAVAAASFATAAVRLRRMRRGQLRLERIVASRTRQLKVANRQLDAMAHLDGLTGVANRRGLDARLSEAWQRCREQRRPLALIAIDVDHFKNYNDQNGHLAGDDLLKEIVAILGACLRRSEDMIGRYGGDEFVAVLPGADLPIAREVAETMHHRVRQARLGTISAGVAAHLPRAGEDVAALLHDADEALYESKRQGRNRVSAHRALA
jgi:diguanylate cyclase (GGDEF)-like protein